MNFVDSFITATLALVSRTESQETPEGIANRHRLLLKSENKLSMSMCYL